MSQIVTEIKKKLKAIEKVALTTDMRGRVDLHFEGLSCAYWDKALAQITEWPKHGHFINVTKNVVVCLLLD